MVPAAAFKHSLSFKSIRRNDHARTNSARPGAAISLDVYAVAFAPARPAGALQPDSASESGEFGALISLQNPGQGEGARIWPLPTPSRPPPTSLGRKQIVVSHPRPALLAAVGYAGKFIEQSIAAYTKSHHITFPNIEYVLWAIVIGLVIANTTSACRASSGPASPPTNSGSRPASCCSARASCSATSSTSAASRCCSAVAITLSLTFMHLLGRSFGLKPKLTSLLASAHPSAESPPSSPPSQPSTPTMKTPPTPSPPSLPSARSRSSPFPLIGHSLHLSDKAYGLWAGLAVDNTAEATAAGALYSDAAGKVAVLAKTTRNALIGFVVLAYAIYWASRGQAQAVGNKAEFLWRKFPKFVLGFLLISLLATLGYFTKPQLTSLANLSRWAFLLDLRGSRPPHQPPRTRQARLEALCRGAIGEVFIALVDWCMERTDGCICESADLSTGMNNLVSALNECPLSPSPNGRQR
jgi:hypothetical protein